jgi:hypothetical protein
MFDLKVCYWFAAGGQLRACSNHTLDAEIDLLQNWDFTSERTEFPAMRWSASRPVRPLYRSALQEILHLSVINDLGSTVGAGKQSL